MPLFTDWLVVFWIGLLVVISPGPNFALTIRHSLVYSRRAGIFTVLGIGVGHLVHMSYCLIGIGAIIARSIVLFNVIKWVGAVYLIYLGIKSLQAKRLVAGVETANNQTITPLAAFRIGLTGDLLNPKATLFFLALFTQLIRPDTPLTAQVLYGGTIAGLAVIWYGLIALLVSQSRVRQTIQSTAHWCERITGAVLILLGLRLAAASHK